MINPSYKHSDLTRRSLLAFLSVTPLCAFEMDASLALSLISIKQAIPIFGDVSTRQLEDALTDSAFRGKLSWRDVGQIASREKRTTDQVMIDLLPVVQLYSRPPLSHFRVGAIVRGSKGDLYFGANIEVPQNVLSFSVHAEQSAVSNAFMNGDTGLKALAVTAAPCGHCRQFLTEFAGAADLRIFIRNGPGTQLSALLPFPFGPKDLGLKATPFSYPGNVLIGSAAPDKLESLALAAAKRSYAPYSKSPSGMQ